MMIDELLITIGDGNFLEDESTKNFARKVADHYSARSNQTLEEREASPIIHLKKLNNWVCVFFIVYDFVVAIVLHDFLIMVLSVLLFNRLRAS
jgi:hypothetical protein